MTVPRHGNSSLHEAPTPASDGEAGTSSTTSAKPESGGEPKLWRRLYAVLSYTPKRCRFDPANPPKFSTALNLLFAFAGAFTVANLYYNHPILHLLADEFSVSNERASLIPTLAQAGYAAGLVLGLCLTSSFSIFCFLTFLTSLTTVTPQLMLPLVGDLAPPHRRASALSIVASGLLLGMLLARLLSGIVTNYTSWRTIYWLSFGLQHLILLLLWLFMPDYPSANPSLSLSSYPHVLWSILTIFIRHPLLIQACLVGFCTSTTFTNFWTTLTFLLAAPPYTYSTLVIGLFALIGIFSMLFAPLYSRLVTDRYVPLFSVILGLLFALTGTLVGTYTGRFTVAGPVVQALLLDFGAQIAQIANRAAIYDILPTARNRVNTAYMISAFVGQLTGTAVGNRVFARGGWVRSGSVSVGFLAAAMGLCLVRGPSEEGWVGWKGGWGLRREGLGKITVSDEEKDGGRPSAEKETSVKEKMESRDR
ncbi:MAG: hypothetical protein Q9208_008264 [Pyrenodesmia sp. 3 TL-2023]